MLAGTVQLSREDQATIDRLSDVAGPLRPREQFDPYLTGYPLPSGTYYVLARTWQDLTVTRAGCVRTLSLIIPSSVWAAAEVLVPFRDLLALDHLPADGDAKSMRLSVDAGSVLPPAFEFKGEELLEALFLEDARPVVVFDAVSPELVAMRLLTSLWPSMRRQFAVSTFALSPRKVGGRDFNLVFAPRDARSKFSDWGGRRIDGRTSPKARHRWTETIVSRVFESAHPRLIPREDEGILQGDGEAGDPATSLRVALLWDELLGKLDSTPTAALGLLDIANSGKAARQRYALTTLEPSLANAIRRAPSVLSEQDAWGFLAAMSRKMHGRSISRGVDAVRYAVGELASRAPEGAVALLSQPDDRGVVYELVPAIANAIGANFSDRTEQALLAAAPEVLGVLIAKSSKLAAKAAQSVPLIARFGEMFPALDTRLVRAVGHTLLPYLVHDWQAPAVWPILQHLDAGELTAEIRHLGVVNDFAASKIADLCLQRARDSGGRHDLLSVICSLPVSERRNALLARGLEPTADDLAWLFQRSGLTREVTNGLVTDLLRRADDLGFEQILGDDRVGSDATSIALIAPDLARRAIFVDGMPLENFVGIVNSVFPGADVSDKAMIGKRALQRCLRQHFGGDEIAFIASMLDGVGERLDGAWVARLGLAGELPASLASRNMVAFRRTSQASRRRLEMRIVDVAQHLRQRRQFDLDGYAVEACADLVSEAAESVPTSALTAAGELLPMLMRQKNRAVSPLVVATFPLLYRELAKKHEVPDVLKFMPFLDWDRCKAARQELVSAFMSSSWPPGDLALTACRCPDTARIMRRTAKSYGGEAYLARLAADLTRLPVNCRVYIERIISAIDSDRSPRYMWED